MMRKLAILGVLGMAAGLLLALPSASWADSCGYGSGYSGGYGSGYNGYSSSYNSYPNSGYNSYAPQYQGSTYPSYSNDYGRYNRSREVIVQPERLHWTPGRGVHTHGEILVPHRGHYDVRRY